MKKLLIFNIIVLLVIIAIGSYPVNPHHKLVKEVVINYNKTDSPYILCGVVRKIYKKYNYSYKDSFYHWWASEDGNHAKYWYTNEFGDTVYISYCDYGDFPEDYRFD